MRAHLINDRAEQKEDHIKMEELMLTRSLEPNNIVRLIFAENCYAPDEGKIRKLMAGTGLFYTLMAS